MNISTTARLPAPDAVLDVTGHQCPLPVLKARKQLAILAVGDVLCVVATDPVSVLDMPNFCREAGHTLLDSREENGRFVFLIRRGEGSVVSGQEDSADGAEQLENK